MFTIFMMISFAISDFVIQTGSIIRDKALIKVRGFLFHGLVLLGTAIPIIILIRPDTVSGVLIRIGLITLIHLTVDLLKELIQKTLKKRELDKKSGVLLFFCEQVIHISVILLIAGGLRISFNAFFTDSVFIKEILTYEKLKAIFILLYISFSGAVFIPAIFNIVYSKIDDFDKLINEKLMTDEQPRYHVFFNEVNTGKWIGILERALIIVFMFSNQLAAIGFVIAAKSLARFKMLDSKLFSEYYLLGTLFSVVYAVIGYLVINSVV